MKKSSPLHYKGFLVTLTLFATAAVLRFYRFGDFVFFQSDSASDLFIVREMVRNHVAPRIGPWLTLSWVHTPPLYYYLLAAWYRLFPTPAGVTAAFALLNIAAIGLLAFMARKLFGNAVNFLVLLFSAVSGQFILESHAIWQPHPVFVTLMASFLFFLLGYQKRSVFDAAIGVFLYTIACAIYPSPILLGPFIIFITSRCLERARSISYPWSILVSTAMLCVSFWLLFGPVLITDWNRGLLLSGISNLTPNLFQPPQHLLPVGLAISDLFDLIMQFSSILPQTWVPWLSAGLTVWIGVTIWIIGRRVMKKPQARVFFSICITLLSGLIILVLFPGQQFGYRLIVYEPFFLTLLALALMSSLHKGPALWRIMTVVVVTLYLLGNIRWIYRSFKSIQLSDEAVARQAALTILEDRRMRSIAKGSYTVDSVVPTKFPHYSVFPVLYMLSDLDDYRMPIVADGNDIDRSSLDHPITTYVYLLCKNFSGYNDAKTSCVTPYREINGNYRPIADIKLEGNIFLFVLTSLPQDIH